MSKTFSWLPIMGFSVANQVFALLVVVVTPAAFAQSNPALTSDPSKPTVCSITLNSVEEKQTFAEHLPNFNHVELFSDKSNWLEDLKGKNIKCDILLISGHFGGSFFGDKGSLSLEQLEAASCNEDYKGIFKQPKEVFLFGCNTLAGKNKERRSLQELVQVYMEHDMTRSQAEQTAAFLLSPFGSSFHDRMRRVFDNPQTRVYGFDGSAPSGKNVEPLLNNYFKSVPDYIQQLTRTGSNQELAKALRNTVYTQALEIQQKENPICILESKTKTPAQKLQWINQVVSTSSNPLAIVPNINLFIRDVFRSNTPFGLEINTQQEIYALQTNQNFKQKSLEFIDKPIDGLMSIQFKVADFAKIMGWMNPSTYKAFVDNQLGDIFKNNLTWEQKDQICSLDTQADLELSQLPKEKWTVATIAAIRCLKVQTLAVSLELTKYLKDQDQNVRSWAVGTLGKIGNQDIRISLALVETLKDHDEYVRSGAAFALGAINNQDIRISLALVEGLKDQDQNVRSYAVNTLAKIGNQDIRIILALMEMLKHQYYYVRSNAAWALGNTGNTDISISLALVDACKDYFPDVRGSAAWALGKLGNQDIRISLALVELLKDVDLPIREQAVKALGEIRNQDVRISLALVEALENQAFNVPPLVAAEALIKIKSKHPDVIKALQASPSSEAKEVLRALQAQQ
jgi:HEAT repeat protein